MDGVDRGVGGGIMLMIPSGYVKIANWKMAIEIVYIPTIVMLIFYSYVKLPEGVPNLYQGLSRSGGFQKFQTSKRPVFLPEYDGFV